MGSKFIIEGVRRDQEMIALYSKHPIQFQDAKNIQINLENIKETVSVIQSVKPDVIIHCAALTDVDYCETHIKEAMTVNNYATVKLFECASKLGIKFIYISTDSVFDGTRGNYNEYDLINPLNIYASSKVADLPNALIIRTNFFGFESGLAKWAIDKLKSGKRINGFTDVIFSPLFVNDLAKLILDMIENNLTGIYHAGSSDSCSKYEFLRLVANEFSLDGDLVNPISIDEVRLIAKRPKNTSLDSTKLQNMLGCKLPTIKEGVKRMVTKYGN